jgi:hypothetical protein
VRAGGPRDGVWPRHERSWRAEGAAWARFEIEMAEDGTLWLDDAVLTPVK